MIQIGMVGMGSRGLGGGIMGGDGGGDEAGMMDEEDFADQGALDDEDNAERVNDAADYEDDVRGDDVVEGADSESEYVTTMTHPRDINDSFT